MKPNNLLAVISALFLLFTASAVAWPSPGKFVPQLEKLIARRLEQRAPQNSQSASAPTSAQSQSASNTDSGSSTITSPASASGSNSASKSGSSGSQSGSGSGSAKSSGSGSGSSNTKATKTSAIDPRLPPGGVSMITPAPTAGQQYYKVGDYVTFAWNYTSLSVTPSYIDVLASCSINSQTYTISSNMSVGATGAVTWDTGNFPSTAPFPVASYTLIIHDSSKDVTAIPSAGYLAAYEQFVFGMYTRQPYTPLNEFKCATCSAALSIHERQALGVLIATSLITLASFTWFANGAGVFS